VPESARSGRDPAVIDVGASAGRGARLQAIAALTIGSTGAYAD
jgi:hypothetical protein